MIKIITTFIYLLAFSGHSFAGFNIVNTYKDKPLAMVYREILRGEKSGEVSIEPTSIEVGNRYLQTKIGNKSYCVVEQRILKQVKELEYVDSFIYLPIVSIDRFQVPCEKNISYDTFTEDEPFLIKGQIEYSVRRMFINPQTDEGVHQLRVMFSGKKLYKNSKGCTVEKIDYIVVDSFDKDEIGTNEIKKNKINCNSF